MSTPPDSTMPGARLQTVRGTIRSGGGAGGRHTACACDKHRTAVPLLVSLRELRMADIPASTLIEFATSLLAGAGVPRDDAAVVATSLVGANLRGHDSHGVMRVLQYVQFVERGEIRLGVDLRVVQETPAMLVCDGQWGLGQVQAQRLLDLLVPKARVLGVAVGAAQIAGTSAGWVSTPSAPRLWD